MSEISKITLPNGTSYDLKDTAARSNINGSMTSTKSVKVYVTDLTHTASIPVSAGTTVKITAIVDCESEAIAQSLVNGVAGNTTYKTLGLLYNGSTVVAKVSDFSFSQSGRLIVGTYTYTNSSNSAVTLTDKSKDYSDTLYGLFNNVCSKDHFIVTSLTYAVEVLETATTNKVSKLETLVGELYQKTAEQEALLKGYADRVNLLEKRNYGFSPMVMPVLDSSLKITDGKLVAWASSQGGGYYTQYTEASKWDPDLDENENENNFFTPNASIDKHGNIYKQSGSDEKPQFLVSDFISSPDERFDYFVMFAPNAYDDVYGSLDRMQKDVNLAVYDKNGTFLWGRPLAMPQWVALIPRDCKVRVAFGSTSALSLDVSIYTGTKLTLTGKTVSDLYGKLDSLRTTTQAATDAANKNSLSIVFKYNGYAVDVLDYDTVKAATNTPTFEADFYHAGAAYNAAKAVMTSYDANGTILGSAITVTNANSVKADGGSLYLSSGCTAIEVKMYAKASDTTPVFTRSCTMIKYASSIVSLTNSVADLQTRVESLESKVSE